MAKEFITYRRHCFRAIRDLLCCEPKETVNAFIAKAKATKTENELIRVMTDLRYYLAVND